MGAHYCFDALGYPPAPRSFVVSPAYKWDELSQCSSTIGSESPWARPPVLSGVGTHLGIVLECRWHIHPGATLGCRWHIHPSMPGCRWHIYSGTMLGCRWHIRPPRDHARVQVACSPRDHTGMQVAHPSAMPRVWGAVAASRMQGGIWISPPSPERLI